MKKVLLTLMAFAFLACNNPQTEDIPTPASDTTEVTPVGGDTLPPYPPTPLLPIRGADLSWLTEQEQMGVLFHDSLGQAQECMALLKDYGMTAVRLRVWVNHPTEGWCNKEDVVVKAKRAADLGLHVMIDFHYSDDFADPSKQVTPAAWKSYSLDELKTAVATHTTDVLTALKQEGVTPDWIQIGNETRNGMLWATGQLWDNSGDLPNGWKNYAALTTAGYDAAKTVFPEATVVVHIDNAYENNNWFFRKLKQNGGKFDAIGLSHYPMTKTDGQEMNKLAANNIKLLYGEFNCPIIMAEIGTLAASNQVPTAVKVIADLRSRLDTLDYFQGYFYWEPQCYGGWKPAEYTAKGWGAYNMGAFTSSGTPNQALIELWK